MTEKQAKVENFQVSEAVLNISHMFLSGVKSHIIHKFLFIEKSLHTHGVMVHSVYGLS